MHPAPSYMVYYSILYLYTHAMMTDLTREQSSIPVSKQIKCSPDNWYDLNNTICKSPHNTQKITNHQWSAQPLPGKWLLPPLTCTTTATCTCPKTTESPLKALLNTLGTCHKTHTMTTRYVNHDAEGVPAPQDSAPLVLAPPDHTMPRWRSDSSNEYNEETDTCCPLAE